MENKRMPEGDVFTESSTVAGADDDLQLNATGGEFDDNLDDGGSADDQGEGDEGDADPNGIIPADGSAPGESPRGAQARIRELAARVAEYEAKIAEYEPKVTIADTFMPVITDLQGRGFKDYAAIEAWQAEQAEAAQRAKLEEDYRAEVEAGYLTPERAERLVQLEVYAARTFKIEMNQAFAESERLYPNADMSIVRANVTEPQFVAKFAKLLHDNTTAVMERGRAQADAEKLQALAQAAATKQRAKGAQVPARGQSSTNGDVMPFDANDKDALDRISFGDSLKQLHLQGRRRG